MLDLNRRRAADHEVALAVTVEVVELGDVPPERAAVLCGLVRTEHAPVLAAQEVHAPRHLRRRADEEVTRPS
jgi:hypothetical protein